MTLDANAMAREVGTDALRSKIDRGAVEGDRDVETAQLCAADPPPRTNGGLSKQTTENGAVSLDDFVAYMPQHAYIFKPSREIWPAASVDVRIGAVAGADKKPISASAWLDTNAAVEQMTWAPGAPTLIRGKIISDGGWIERPGCTIFNLYRPPTIVPKRASAEPWLGLIRRLFQDDAEHVIHWLAHRVQRPQEKINHALVLGGAQGIGKDTLLHPVKQAVGPWNFAEVSPQQLIGRFNGFLKSVICRVNEARDLGDVDRFAFYDHLKSYTAAPPDVLRVDEKNLREYSVPNVVGVIITSNHKADGIYLPADDRRHFVAWSNLVKEDFTEDFWTDLWCWYDTEGNEAVAAYLGGIDLSPFNAKAAPPKTQAFWEIVDASRMPEDAELADAIEMIGSPEALTLEMLACRADVNFAEWLRDRKNARRIPHRLEDCGYVAVRNETAKDGLWKIEGKRRVIYAKSDLSIRDRFIAANNLLR